MQKKHFPLNPPNNLTIFLKINQIEIDFHIPNDSYERNYGRFLDRRTEEKGTVVLSIINEKLHGQLYGN
jgi:hypothetical protein